MKTQLLKLSPREFCAATKACDEGVKFAARFQSMSAVWRACPRVDWLIWILNVIEAKHDEKAERLFAIWCARNTPLGDGRTTGDLLTDRRSINALAVAERFASGDATREELTAARDAAWSASLDAAGSSAWYAASHSCSSAWYAASPACSAARYAASPAGSSAAWDAASHACSATGSAAWDAARSAQSAELRRVIKNPFA